jgi:hypothetical protein
MLAKTGWNSVFLKTGMDTAGIAFVSAPLYKEGGISTVLSKSLINSSGMTEYLDGQIYITIIMNIRKIGY